MKAFNEDVDTKYFQPSDNFSTVAILPVSDDVPLTQFGHELYESLSWIGNCFKQNFSIIDKLGC